MPWRHGFLDEINTNIAARLIPQVIKGRAEAGVSMIERAQLTLYVRTFSGWERLRGAVAGALGVPLEEVRELRAAADPAVRIDALASVMGFRLRVELYIDASRASVPKVDVLAVELARRLGEDVAHHDNSASPYGYVLVRSNGERLALDEDPDRGADGLLLDETTGSLRPVPPLGLQ